MSSFYGNNIIIDKNSQNNSGGASKNDVNFYDYDGSIVASYTAAQFATLEEMPENPDHTDEGLTSQGWNWSFDDAKTYVAKYGKLNVGQMYVPTDGKTHVFINIPTDDPSYETTLYFGHTTASGQTVVDWGDGTPTETASGKNAAEYSHTYANPGKYEITLDTVSGVMSVYGTTNNRTATHFSGSGNYTRNLTRIEEIRFSSKDNIGTYAFAYCYALQSITMSSDMTNIGGYAFQNCYALRNITIPDSVTDIWSYTFNSCYTLQSVTIPNSVTNIENDAFSACYNLQDITLPGGITSINGSAFRYFYTLRNITIPDSVTSIEGYTFQRCYSLRNITIPDSVTDIGAYAFADCGAIAYHFKRNTPPTLSNTNAFSGISADTVFYVPASSLNAYKTASRWSTYADRIVAEPE